MKNKVIKVSYVAATLVLIISVISMCTEIKSYNLIPAIISGLYGMLVILANKDRQYIV